MEWLRAETDLTALRKSLLFPAPAADAGLNVAEMPDSETVCGCVGVTKGSIIAAIHEKGVSTLPQLKDCTRASTGCGRSPPPCTQFLRPLPPTFQQSSK